MKNPPTILLALGWYDHRLLQGIAAYAAEHHWHISAASITSEFVIPWGWKGNGVLAWLAGEEELTEFVVSLKKPTVDFSLRHAHLPLGHVVLDHGAASKLAADHFVERGFHNFLFYSDADNWTFEERGRGFIEALRGHGRSCTWIKRHKAKAYQHGRGEWPKRRAWLADQLRNAPKPAAVFTANGTLAVEVQEVCKLSGLDVPSDVAIIGIEDDLLLPQSMQQEITAVDPNLAELGHRGAALLDQLMKGERRPESPIRISPARLIARRSTDIMAVTHPGLLKALRFIGENFTANVDVDAIARVAGMSRRGLHQAFMDRLNRTPGEHLRSMRMDHAKKLLIETDNKIETIATLSGYPGLNTFFVAFKRNYGISPAEYRKEAQRGS
jgi:LacI family transcriptional regulator